MRSVHANLISKASLMSKPVLRCCTHLQRTRSPNGSSRDCPGHAQPRRQDLPVEGLERPRSHRLDRTASCSPPMLRCELVLSGRTALRRAPLSVIGWTSGSSNQGKRMSFAVPRSPLSPSLVLEDQQVRPPLPGLKLPLRFWKKTPVLGELSGARG